MGISAFLIVLNEEKKISRTLDALRWADETVVVDSGSTDDTIEICRQKGARVFSRPFDHFEAQKNYALSLTTQEWVLSIDADERVSAALAEEIRKVTATNPSIAGYWIKRHNYFFGKRLRFAKQGKEQLLRLFRKNRGKFSGLVHESVSVDGPTGTLANALDHYGTETIEEYFAKLKLYTDLEVTRMISDGRIPSSLKAIFFPPAKWLLNYVFLGGFLDARSGLFYHALSCYYDWVKNLKARRKRNALQRKFGNQNDLGKH